jgi:hypothetical protein
MQGAAPRFVLERVIASASLQMLPRNQAEKERSATESSVVSGFSGRWTLRPESTSRIFPNFLIRQSGEFE